MRGIGIGFVHAQCQGFQRAAEHPAGMGVELGADGAALAFDFFQQGFAADGGTCHHVGMTAHVFGEGIHRQVRAVFERALEHRAEQGVVANQQGFVAVLLWGQLLGNVGQ